MLINRTRTRHAACARLQTRIIIEFQKKISQTQKKSLCLIEEDLTPLLLLENVFQIDCIYLPDVPAPINSCLKRFGRRNLWHGMLPIYFCKWFFHEYMEDTWVSIFSTLCIVAITFSTIRTECDKIIQHNVRTLFDYYGMLPLA